MLLASRSRCVRLRWDAFQPNKGQSRPSLVGKDQLIRSRLSQRLLATSMSRTVLRAVWTYRISLRFPSCFQTFLQSMLAVVRGDYLKLNEINPIRKALGSFCYSVV